MAVISCTKKLVEQGHFPLSPVPEIGYKPLYSWHAHHFKIGRKNCVMFMNDLTRYQLVLYGMRKEHYNHFEELFLSHLEIVLKADKFTGREIDTFLSNMGTVIYTNTHNRSILGSINDQIFITEAWIQKYLPTDDLNIVNLNVKLNDSVMLKLEEFSARLALKKVLQQP